MLTVYLQLLKLDSLLAIPYQIETHFQAPLLSKLGAYPTKPSHSPTLEMASKGHSDGDSLDRVALAPIQTIRS